MKNTPTPPKVQTVDLPDLFDQGNRIALMLKDMLVLTPAERTKSFLLAHELCAALSADILAALGANAPTNTSARDYVMLTGDDFQVFRQSVYDIANANGALAASVPLFPVQHFADTGEVDVDIAIEAFGGYIGKRLTTLVNILDGEYKK